MRSTSATEAFTLQVLSKVVTNKRLLIALERKEKMFFKNDMDIYQVIYMRNFLRSIGTNCGASRGMVDLVCLGLDSIFESF